MKCCGLLFAFVGCCVSVAAQPTLPLKPELSVDSALDTITVKIMHNPKLPIGSKETCTPPDIGMADDGLPMSAGRAYELGGTPGLKEMGVHHLTVDWNPCGHPPAGVWTMPHYDIHFYTITSEERKKMKCGTSIAPGLPVCAKTEDPADAKFFTELTDAAKDRMPEKHKGDPAEHGVDEMGVHWWDHADQPKPGEWKDPGQTIYLAYDGNYIGFEVMPPLSWFGSGAAPKYTWEPKYKDEAKLDGWMPIKFELTSKGEMPEPEIVAKIYMKDFGSAPAGAPGAAPAPAPAPASADTKDTDTDSARHFAAVAVSPIFLPIMAVLLRSLRA